MSEAYWQAVLASGVDVPPDRDLNDMTTELVTMLGDPRPRRRDDLAYPILATWISRGVYDDLLVGLGDGIVVGLEHGLGADGDDSVLRRSFSALILAEILGRDNEALLLPGDVVMRWGDQVTSWFVRERDLRGWAPGRGWVHSVAHGADLLGQLGRSRHFGALELTVLLDVVGDRVLAPTSYVLQHGEDDRLAYAVMTILHRNIVEFRVVEPWLSRIGAGIRQPPARGGGAEWPTPAATNAVSLLRALHVQLALGVRGRADVTDDAKLFAEPTPNRADLLLVVLDQLRAASPWLFQAPAAATVAPPALETGRAR
ncbi:MAG TPA: DUF2785 domain-containing protein [Nocardioidaceae bacterium]|nr:DUF2785 domain-containing protein [Nocardioidaceae bacterium]